MQYNAIQCNNDIQYTQCNTMKIIHEINSPYNVMQYNILQCKTMHIKCNTIQMQNHVPNNMLSNAISNMIPRTANAIQCNTILYNATMQYNTHNWNTIQTIHAFNSNKQYNLMQYNKLQTIQIQFKTIQTLTHVPNHVLKNELLNMTQHDTNAMQYNAMHQCNTMHTIPDNANHT